MVCFGSQGLRILQLFVQMLQKGGSLVAGSRGYSSAIQEEQLRRTLLGGCEGEHQNYEYNLWKITR